MVLNFRTIGSVNVTLKASSSLFLIYFRGHPGHTPSLSQVPKSQHLIHHLLGNSPINLEPIPKLANLSLSNTQGLLATMGMIWRSSRSLAALVLLLSATNVLAQNTTITVDNTTVGMHHLVPFEVMHMRVLANVFSQSPMHQHLLQLLLLSMLIPPPQVSLFSRPRPFN